MIYQIHFPKLVPFSVLRLRNSLDLNGYCSPEPSVGNVYHISYMIINQETLEYSTSNTETPNIPMIEWTENLCAELQLVPIEVWEQYIAGAI